MLTLADLFIVLLFASAAAWLWRGHGIRERALALVRRHCEKMDVLLLDDNVALRRLSLLRDAHGRRRLARVYGFELASTSGRSNWTLIPSAPAPRTPPSQPTWCTSTTGASAHRRLPTEAPARQPAAMLSRLPATKSRP